MNIFLETSDCTEESRKDETCLQLKMIVGEPRDQNKANFNKVRQIAKFGMIVYYKIVINNLI